MIAGAGPAGMTLAYLLASNGLAVRVLERHPDFDREFRGEYVQPSSVEALRAIGLPEVLAARGLAIPDVHRRLYVGRTREVMKTIRESYDQGMLVSQPGLLDLLHQECSRFPAYRIDFGVSASEPILEADRVVALKTRTADGREGRVDGDVFIACNGRGSGLRRAPGLEIETFQQPADALWLRMDFADGPDVLPRGVDVHMFGRGLVVVLFPTTGNRLQIAYSAPGDLAALRRDVPELKRRLLPTLPAALRPLVDARLDAKTDWQILKIGVDRLKRWWLPGMLFLGDAAHQMSPSGAMGINLAFLDAIVAANEIVTAVKAGDAVDVTVFARIEAARRAETEAAQSNQIRAGKMVMKPLPALHAIFTLIGSMIWLFTAGGRKAMKEAAPPAIAHPVPLRGAQPMAKAV